MGLRSATSGSSSSLASQATLTDGSSDQPHLATVTSGSGPSSDQPINTTENPTHGYTISVISRTEIAPLGPDNDIITVMGDSGEKVDAISVSIPSPCKASDNNTESHTKLLLLLAQCLLSSGCPSYRAEDALQHTSRWVGLDATFSFLPDSVLVTFVKDKALTESIMVKTCQSYDTGKIGEINSVLNAFFKETIDLSTCLSSLDAIANAPATSSYRMMILAFAGSSFSASATMFGGSWMDAAASGGLGLLVGLLFTLACQYPIYGRVFEVSASVIIAIIARALHQYVCFTGVAVAAILILLPGYSMTMAVVSLHKLKIAKPKTAAPTQHPSDLVSNFVLDGNFSSSYHDRHYPANLCYRLRIYASLWITDGQCCLQRL
ncbi:hypothetical protein EC973_003462 [Apophysomyces ossiformis]|uniref:Threonine/serine exporter-like N-terminal domain-containing protein n=1 Tax=Apophysomyces ossiformis TaxID=679940 RepID=A0A8H7BJJ0_9FUNG|nr:hypothetical protein EC973_003462 [Apophysomyces ossiformis]